MRHFKTKFSDWAILPFLTLLLFSCSQIDVFQSEDLSDKLEESSSRFLLDQYLDNPIYGASTLPDCSDGCVEEPVVWTAVFFARIEVYNDAENLIMEFDLDEFSAFFGVFELYYSINDGSFQKSPGFIDPSDGGTFQELIPLDEGFEACGTVLTSFGLDIDNDGAIDFNFDPNYGVYQFCEGNDDPNDEDEEDPEDEDKEPADCVLGLSVDLSCEENNHIATFTFFAEEAGPIVIQGGLTNGTFNVSGSSNVLTQNTSHPSTNRSRANVTRWEGNVEACEEVSITINFSGGNGIGSWTAQSNGDILGSTSPQTCN
jgi:hypothetical protein